MRTLNMLDPPGLTPTRALRRFAWDAYLSIAGVFFPRRLESFTLPTAGLNELVAFHGELSVAYNSHILLYDDINYHPRLSHWHW